MSLHLVSLGISGVQPERVAPDAALLADLQPPFGERLVVDAVSGVLVVRGVHRGVLALVLLLEQLRRWWSLGH